MATDYTVKIKALTEPPTIAPNVENITNVSLTVSSLVDGQPGPPNDANNLSLQENDTIKWQIGANSLADWDISNVFIGKKFGNVNSVTTAAVFDGTQELPDDAGPVIPASVVDLRQISSPTAPTTIKVFTGQGNPSPFPRVLFRYRINFTGTGKNNAGEKWFIDPEIDVSPDHD